MVVVEAPTKDEGVADWVIAVAAGCGGAALVLLGVLAVVLVKRRGKKPVEPTISDAYSMPMSPPPVSMSSSVRFDYESTGSEFASARNDNYGSVGDVNQNPAYGSVGSSSTSAYTAMPVLQNAPGVYDVGQIAPDQQ